MRTKPRKSRRKWGPSITRAKASNSFYTVSFFLFAHFFFPSFRFSLTFEGEWRGQWRNYEIEKATRFLVDVQHFLRLISRITNYCRIYSEERIRDAFTTLITAIHNPRVDNNFWKIWITFFFKYSRVKLDVSQGDTVG